MAIGDTAEMRQWDGHLLLLHATESERRSRVASWVRRGLEHGEKVIYTESPFESADGSAMAILEDHGVDARKATDEGRLAIISLADFLAPGAGMSLLTDPLADDAYQGVRFSADCNDALVKVPIEVYLGVEEAMDGLCRTMPFSAMCRYDQALSSEDDLRRAYHLHVSGVRERQVQIDGTQDGLALSGEIDISNHTSVSGALEAGTAGLSGSFVVDLSAVTFLDVAGCRALLRGSELFRDNGGDLLLSDAQHLVDLALRMLSVDRLPHVKLVRGLG